jgi:hypothetical protein
VIHFPSQAIDDGAGFIKALFPTLKVIVTCHGAIPVDGIAITAIKLSHALNG